MNAKSMEYKQRVSIFQVENKKKVRILSPFYYCISLVRDTLTHTAQHSYTDTKNTLTLSRCYSSSRPSCSLLLSIISIFLGRCVFSNNMKSIVVFGRVCGDGDDDCDAKQLQNCLDVSVSRQKKKHCFHFTHFARVPLCFRFCLCFFSISVFFDFSLSPTQLCCVSSVFLLPCRFMLSVIAKLYFFS